MSEEVRRKAVVSGASKPLFSDREVGEASFSARARREWDNGQWLARDWWVRDGVELSFGIPAAEGDLHEPSGKVPTRGPRTRVSERL
jgi:hypothetical protein